MNATTWYVWHKDTFIKGSQTTLEQTVPEYSNVFKVECVDDFKFCHCDVHCKFTARTGQPCVHILRILEGECHPKMFHPRHLKVYNDDNTFQNTSIKEALLRMISWKRCNKHLCVIEDLMPHDVRTFDQTLSPHTDLVSVIAVDLLNRDKKVLLKGDEVPNEYLKKAQASLSYRIASIDDEEQQIHLSHIENDERSNVLTDQNDKSCVNTFTDKEDEEYSYGNFRQFLDVYMKDMDKYMRTYPQSYPEVKQKILDVMTWQMQLVNDAVQKSEADSHGLVSSNNAIERSPNGKRYKPFHERLGR